MNTALQIAPRLAQARADRILAELNQIIGRYQLPGWVPAEIFESVARLGEELRELAELPGVSLPLEAEQFFRLREASANALR